MYSRYVQCVFPYGVHKGQYLTCVYKLKIPPYILPCLAESTERPNTSYIGGNATLIWNTPNMSGLPVICFDNRHKIMLQIINCSMKADKYEYASRKVVQAFLGRPGYTFGFTLTNVTMDDAGMFTCEEGPDLVNNGTIFVWNESE